MIALVSSISLRDGRVEVERLVVVADGRDGGVRRASQRPLHLLGVARHLDDADCCPCPAGAAPHTRPSQRWMPSMPDGFHGPPWSHGPMNIRNARTVSAP